MAEKSRLDTIMDRLRLDLVRTQPAELSPEFVVAALEEMKKRIDEQERIIRDLNHRTLGSLSVG